MSTVSADNSWQLAGTIAALPGYAYGCRYPSLMFSFAGRPLRPEDRDELQQCFATCCPGLTMSPEPTGDSVDWQWSVLWLLSLWQAVQRAQGIPVYSPGQILALSGTQVRCLLPSSQSSHRAMAMVVQCTLMYLAHDDREHHIRQQAVMQAIKALGGSGAKGSNVPRFIKAADELGLPFMELPGGVYQYGTGRHARWLDSSFTDVTPAISARLSRNKILAAAMLRQAGLPVPVHHVVSDVRSAVQAARTLGYPVVVKPADLDGGIGVAAGLESDEEVQQAFAAACSHSNTILVEKHVEGRDYRITVFNGRVIWAIERVPAGVTGDGSRNVRELVNEINIDPRRGSGKHSPLQQLLINDEAIRLLEHQNLTDCSIPGLGRFVRLRRAANVASGGTPIAVFDQLHPDNAKLAVRAAEALRLDLAGIDLLIPDISRSWQDSGAAICEVNGQPNLGQTTAAHLYAPILQHLVPGSGRVPTIVVVGAPKPDDWIQALKRQLMQANAKPGVASAGEVSIDGEIIFSGAGTTFEPGKMLTLNRQVGSIVFNISDDSVLHTGLPMQYCDAVILAGTNLQATHPLAKTRPQRWLAELLSCLLPACDGVVVSLPGHSFSKEQLSKWTTADLHEIDGDVEHVVETLMRLLSTALSNREGSGS